MVYKNNNINYRKICKLADILADINRNYVKNYVFLDNFNIYLADSLADNAIVSNNYSNLSKNRSLILIHVLGRNFAILPNYHFHSYDFNHQFL